MRLSLPDDSEPIAEMFERLFEAESTPQRVRAAEPVGFDPGLWQALISVEAPFIRLDPELGGGGLGLLDACVMMERAGRRLASVPLAESVVALRLLGQANPKIALEWVEKLRTNSGHLTLALQMTEKGREYLVPGGAVATGILTFNGEALALEMPTNPLEAPPTLAGNASGLMTAESNFRIILSTGAEAEAQWQQAIEEWKLLMAAALIGLSREAISMGAAYATERTAFGVPIGTNQAISHPLANHAIDADGAAMYLWWTLKAIEESRPEAAASVSLVYWWAAQTAGTSVAHALHVFGGYGLTNEYDIQLYHRRAKSWALALGDPKAELLRGGRRLVSGELVHLPDPGHVDLNFEAPGAGSELAAETREVFSRILDPGKHRLGEANFEAHDWEVHRTLGAAGLLYPDWPVEWGGRGASADEARASTAVWHEVGYIGHARSVTAMVGAIVRSFGQEELKDEVLLRFAQGDATACLGYTEPSGGSDVFAAKTRAQRDGADWVINGQKMFTSGAELASYVLLIARTDPNLPKHKGLTLFLVPLDREGIEIHPVHTFMDERTNATFYADVRIPDRYRLGEVNGGVRVMAAALSMEQGGSSYHFELQHMLQAVTEWARTVTREGQPLIDDVDFLRRIGRVEAEARIGEALSARALWASISKQPDIAAGPASKVFSTESFIKRSADLLDLAAPLSLIKGSKGLGLIETGYRHSTATSIYGGTSEVLRSLVAERRLGLPRSRS